MPLPIDVITILSVQSAAWDGLEEIRRTLQARGIEVIQQPPILRRRGAYDSRRRQYRAEVVLDRGRLSAARPVLAVTDADCYAGNLNFFFGMAELAGGVALLSLHRLRTNASLERLRQHIGTEVSHDSDKRRACGTVAVRSG